MRLKILFIILILCIIFAWNFKIIHVVGTSMNPTLGDGDMCLCLSTNNVNRGDIIGFRYKNKYLVKRIVGLPGETVFVNRHTVTILDTNGQILRMNEKYISTTVKNPDKVMMELGKDEFFVLGDNREVALDSPEIGPVKRKQIDYKFIMQITRWY